MAESVNNYLKKGSLVYIEGELSGELTDGNNNPRIWQGSDGESRASYEITARNVKFLGGGEGNGGGYSPSEPPPQSGYGSDSDPLPF